MDRTRDPNRCSRRAGALVLASLLMGALAASAETPAARAERLLSEGRAVAALAPLAEAFEEDPGSEEGRRVLWRLAREAGPAPELAEAIEVAAPRLGSDGWIATGVLLRRALRPLDALEAFDRAPPDAGEAPRPEADIEAGRLFAEFRSHQRALERFGRHREHPAAIHGRAVTLARMLRTEEAFVLTESLLSVDPGHRGGRLLRAELLDSVGRGGEAESDLRRLMEETGPAGPAAFRLAGILVRQGSGAEALPIFEAVVAEAPTNAEAWLGLGRALRDAGRGDEAETALRRALAADPALNEARIALARLLARRGDQEGAAPLFAEFERRSAFADESARLLGEAEHRPEVFRPASAFVLHALRHGDLPLALRGAQRFLVEFPDDFERHILLARVFAEGGSRPDAERVLRRALERFRGDGAAERRLEAALAALARR